MRDFSRSHALLQERLNRGCHTALVHGFEKDLVDLQSLCALSCPLDVKAGRDDYDWDVGYEFDSARVFPEDLDCLTENNEDKKKITRLNLRFFTSRKSLRL